MEEAIENALHAAGDVLADALRAGLVARGLADTLAVARTPGRVIIVSRETDVCTAERGRPGQPPSGALAAIARAARDDVVRVLRARLEEATR